MRGENIMFKVYNKEFTNVFTALDHLRQSGFSGVVINENNHDIVSWLKNSDCEYETNWYENYNSTSHLTIKEAAYLLGVSAVRVTQFCQQKRIKARRFGKAWSITLDELEKFSKIPRISGPEGWLKK